MYEAGESQKPALPAPSEVAEQEAIWGCVTGKPEAQVVANVPSMKLWTWGEQEVPVMVAVPLQSCTFTLGIGFPSGLTIVGMSTRTPCAQASELNNRNNISLFIAVSGYLLIDRLRQR